MLLGLAGAALGWRPRGAEGAEPVGAVVVVGARGLARRVLPIFALPAAATALLIVRG